MSLSARAARSHGARRPRLWREVLGGLLLFGVYTAVARIDWSGRDAAAAAHGRLLFDLERMAHLEIEHTLNGWLVPHPTLRVIANYEYASTYVLSALAMLLWLYIRMPDWYRWARNSFVVLNLIAFGCFAVYPVTPPRLLPDLGFVDTVREGHTWGSWGSPLVGHANQLAAMPSLHIAWSLWVSVVLAAYAGGRLVQWTSAAHVMITALVIMATANHYLVDGFGGVLLVSVSFWLLSLFQKRPARDGDSRARAAGQRARRRGERVPAADSFFLHVESAAFPQHVGGIALLDTSQDPFDRDQLAETIKEHLPELPRLREKLAVPGRWLRRWRRVRWIDAPELDWAWHVPARDLSRSDGRPGGMAALHAFAAELAGERLPRDRPLWRFAAVTGFAPGRAAAVLVMHHVVADGVGTVAQVMNMMAPKLPLSTLVPPRPNAPGWLRRAGATAIGLAQLATGGFPSLKLPVSGTPQRRFATVDLPLDEVRAVTKRHHAHVSDVLLATIAGALRREMREPVAGESPMLRVAVPLMVREPGTSGGIEGNLTAAFFMDLPIGPLSEAERLAEVVRVRRRRNAKTRVLASRFVMGTVGGLMPPPLHAWFARTVYGGRFFQGIVSNMPGPRIQLRLAGPPLLGAYPILPLAPGAPFAAGALGWNGVLCVALATDPLLVDDADALAQAIRAVFEELQTATPVGALGEVRGGVPAPGAERA